MNKPFSFIASTVVALYLTGCGGVPALPESFDVATSATDKSQAAKDSGPPGLASSTWSLERLPDPNDSGADASDSTPSGPYGGILNGDALERPPVGERIFLVEFGDQGQMTHVTENRFFLPQYYSDEISIDSDWHQTTLPGVVYNSASYGLEVGGRFGLAVIVHVRLGNLFLGQALLYSWGTQDADTINGAFGYLLDFTDGIVPSLGTIADQYPIVGERVSAE